MQIINIEETKPVVEALLGDPWFQDLLLYRAEVRSGFRLELEGRINTAFYQDETEEIREKVRREQFLPWRDCSGIFFQALRGEKLPLSFQVHLLLPESRIAEILGTNASETEADVENMSLNFQYTRQQFVATSVTTLRTFSREKEIEALWDDAVKKKILVIQGIKC